MTHVYRNNGNNTLFTMSFFTFLVPDYTIFSRGSMATTFYFYYIFLAYCLMYFTEMRNFKKGIVHKRNDNETHYSGVIFGAILGMLMRRRLLRNVKF